MRKLGRTVAARLRRALRRKARRKFLKRTLISAEYYFPRALHLVYHTGALVTCLFIRGKLLLSGRTTGAWDSVEALFIHVPKTAGTSLATALAPHGLLRISSLWELLVSYRSDEATPRFLTLDHLSTDWLVHSGLISKKRMRALATVAVLRLEQERKASALRHLSTGRIPSGAQADHVLRRIEGGLWRHCCKNVFGLNLATNPDWLLAGPRYRGPLKLFQFGDLAQLEAFLGRIVGQGIELPHQMRGRDIGGRWETPVGSD